MLRVGWNDVRLAPTVMCKRALQEGLKIAIRARMWEVGDKICAARPDLAKELAAARGMADEGIEVWPAADIEMFERECPRRVCVFLGGMRANVHACMRL